MINYLTDDLPEAIQIDDITYNINFDFKTCIKIIVMWEDAELLDAEKMMLMLKLLYKNEIPPNIEEAQRMAVKFLNGGMDNEEMSEKQTTRQDLGRMYSFKQDSQYIYTAVYLTFGINQEQLKSLHWWIFLAMFSDLSESFFTYLMHIRKQLKTGKLTKDERQWYYEHKDIVDLEDNYTEDEKALFDAFINGR